MLAVHRRMIACRECKGYWECPLKGTKARLDPEAVCPQGRWPDIPTEERLRTETMYRQHGAGPYPIERSPELAERQAKRRRGRVAVKAEESVPTQGRNYWAERVRICARCPDEGTWGCHNSRTGCEARWAAADPATVCPQGLWPRLPLLSVCINSADEGPRLAVTVADLRRHLGSYPHEVLVVADGAGEGTLRGVPADVRVIAHATPIGCGQAKAELLAAARGEVILFADAHQAVRSGDLVAMVVYAVAHRVVVTPYLCHLAYDEEWGINWPGAAAFAPKDEAVTVGRHGQYRVASADEQASPREVIMPSCVTVASREAWETIGGWNQYAGVLGAQERGLALRAYGAAVPVVLYPVVMGHEFQATGALMSRPMRPYRPRPGGYAENMWHAYRVVMEDHAWQMIRLALEAEGWHCADVEEDATVLAERRDYLGRRRVRTDAEMVALLRRLGMAQPSLLRDTGGAAMEPAALLEVRARARGNCLDLGTGSGSATRALLAGGAELVWSVDHDPRFRAAHDARVRDLVVPRLADGFYDLSACPAPFDVIVVDGPPGGEARRHALDHVLPLLADGGAILMDDARRDRALIDAAAGRLGLEVEHLPTHRGLAVVTEAAMR